MDLNPPEGIESEERFNEVVGRLLPDCKYDRTDPRFLMRVVLEVQRTTGYDADKLRAHNLSKFLDIVEVAADMREEEREPRVDHLALGRQARNQCWLMCVVLVAACASLYMAVRALLAAEPPAI